MTRLLSEPNVQSKAGFLEVTMMGSHLAPSRADGRYYSLVTVGDHEESTHPGDVPENLQNPVTMTGRDESSRCLAEFARIVRALALYCFVTQ
jgi:hypothetical protein